MKRKKVIATVLSIVGCVMISISVAYVVISTVQQNNAVKNAEEIIAEIHNVLPDVTDFVPKEATNTDMPVMEIEQQNFVGIIEVPSYTKELPIYASWDKRKLTYYPCRFSGSSYNNNLIIGGNSNTGQFDFMKTISLNDDVYITDFYGCRFKYSVTDIQITKDVSAQNLNSYDADLLLFAPDKYSLDYTVISCELS